MIYGYLLPLYLPAAATGIAASGSGSLLTVAAGSGTLSGTGSAAAAGAGSLVTVNAGAGALNGSAELAAQFTSANDEYLSVPSNPSLQTGDIDFAVSGWIYNDSQANGRLYITKGVTFGNHEFCLFNSSGDSYMVRIEDGAISARIDGSARTGQWDFVTFWHDATANTLNLQVNNGTVASASYSGGIIANADPFSLGGGVSTADHDGRMQGVTFHKRVLTAAERTWLYNDGDGRHYSEYGCDDDGVDLRTSLISCLLLNEPNGTRFDSHGTNHLTDNNTVTTSAGVITDPETGFCLTGEGAAVTVAAGSGSLSGSGSAALTGAGSLVTVDAGAGGLAQTGAGALPGAGSPVAVAAGAGTLAGTGTAALPGAGALVTVAGGSGALSGTGAVSLSGVGAAVTVDAGSGGLAAGGASAAGSGAMVQVFGGLGAVAGTGGASLVGAGSMVTVAGGEGVLSRVAAALDGAQRTPTVIYRPRAQRVVYRPSPGKIGIS